MLSLSTLSSVSAALLLAVLPAVPLRAQQDDAMKKDHATRQDHAAMAMGEPSAQGKLVGVENHKASGTVHIINAGAKRQLHFTADFSAEKGPDVYVTLTDGPKPVKGMSLVIARLTRFSGEQSYELPTTADLNKYSHLVLWCRKYSVAMAEAKLSSPGTGKMDGVMGDEGATMEKKDEMGKPPTSKPN